MSVWMFFGLKSSAFRGRCTLGVVALPARHLAASNVPASMSAYLPSAYTAYQQCGNQEAR
jgi:hypothetical protein